MEGSNSASKRQTNEVDTLAGILEESSVGSDDELARSYIMECQPFEKDSERAELLPLGLAVLNLLQEDIVRVLGIGQKGVRRCQLHGC